MDEWANNNACWKQVKQLITNMHWPSSNIDEMMMMSDDDDVDDDDDDKEKEDEEDGRGKGELKGVFSINSNLL